MPATDTTPAPAPPEADHDPHRMQCMEVWGGNRAVDNGVVMGGLDAWVYSRPYGDDDGADGGGGDVYYVSSCVSGRITRLLVADVSGHGAVVSAVAGQLRWLMRRYVNHVDQCRLVAELNREFAALSTAGRFATAVVATLWGPTRDLSICNAGHPPPLVYRAAERKWGYLTAAAAPECGAGGPTNGVTNIPLGIDDCDYVQFETRLGVGDMVLCYTDSLPEARDATGELLGQAGLLEVARTIDASDPARVIPNLLAAIAPLAPGNLTTDDVTALLFRPNGLAPILPLRDRLLVPLRLLGGLLASLAGRGPAPLPELSLPNVGGAILPSLNRRPRHRAK